MTSDVDLSAFELCAIHGEYAGYNGAEIAICMKDALFIAEIDEEPVGIEPGEDVVAHAVRMNHHGWFKCFYLVRA